MRGQGLEEGVFEAVADGVELLDDRLLPGRHLLS